MTGFDYLKKKGFDDATCAQWGIVLEDFAAKKKKVVKDVKPTEEIVEVIEYFNKIATKAFSPKTKITIGLLGARLKQYSVDQVKSVIDVKTKQWKDDEHMARHLCPSTLFAQSNFEKYLNEVPNVKPAPVLGFKSKSSNEGYEQYVKEQVLKGENWESFESWSLLNH